MTPLVPDAVQIDRRLSQILARDSANVGALASTDRLTVMLTRSCELRCSYCFVGVSEDGHGRDAEAGGAGIPTGDLGHARLRLSIDLLMRSARPRLALQLFGGEPTRRWDLLEEAITYSVDHPGRRARSLELLVTTNGIGLDPDDAGLDARLAVLRRPEIVVELSIDGDARGSRFRRGHLLTTDAAASRLERLVPRLRESGVRWFANVTLPPAAASEVLERYRWARAIGAPALQLNYATGMSYSDAQFASYLEGLQRVLSEHHQDPRGLELLNWNNGADPVPLCADVMIDVDGTILQMGGIFHEKRFPALRAAYHRGALESTTAFEGLRIPLGALFRMTRRALSPEDWAVFESNTRLGAAVDLVVHVTRRRLGLGHRRIA